jgi:hypothetical protein
MKNSANIKLITQADIYIGLANYVFTLW